MAGTLYVVATPIGHLDDLTARARRVLGEVAVVAAEDTRRTGNLLRHVGLRTPLVSLHAHNEQAQIPSLLARLHDGASVAVVSDAGTPGISDPGARLVRAARAADIRVEPVPGPSAVSAAISVAGLDDHGFCFMGFPPIKKAAQRAWFDHVRQILPIVPVICFEAPHKIRQTIEILDSFVDYQIIVFRELTKQYEEVLTGNPRDVLNRLDAPRGEFTIVIPRRLATEAPAVSLPEHLWRDEIGRLTENGARSRREAARALARQLGVSTRRVYNATRD